ncbi:mannan endo-1,4-beta-mannosidase [Anaerotaenia torta]|uniref:glycosyl hydrolase n=1 Tax=Anaerotaenia torta TaxID=433293 RepID=UPI003D1DD63F
MKKIRYLILAAVLWSVAVGCISCRQDGQKNEISEADALHTEGGAMDKDISQTEGDVSDEGESIGKENTPEEVSSQGAARIWEKAPLYLEGEQEVVCTVEAEDGVFTGNVTSREAASDSSGTGYAEGFHKSGDTCTLAVQIGTEGFYDLVFLTASAGGYKENYIYADDEKLGVIATDSKDFKASVLERVYLTEGEHKIKVESYWGYIMLDRLEIHTAKELNPQRYQVSPVLVNANATDNTKRLMSYLCDIYDEYFLSGQYCSTGQYGKEFAVVKKTTDRTPAVLGLDFIEYTPSRVERGSSGNQTKLAIDFWKSGGIVTFCWHWNAPAKYLTGEWYRGFYTDATNINLKKIMDGKDPEGYDLLMKDIDAIARELLVLQEAGVPILWRPLHEASGGWFWWGASGAEAFKKLYLLLYERLTVEYGLNNLIWVWNGQDGEWYPGDDYVDIIGEDIYPGERVYTSQAARYIKAQSYTEAKKLVYLTENGCVFDPDLALRDRVMWGMWCTWSGEFVAKDIGIFTISEQYTEEEMLKKAYRHEKVLTLEELPDLTSYPINGRLVEDLK